MDLCGFLAAEEAGTGALNLIIDECVAHLYQEYIDEKAYPYARDEAISSVLGECTMAFQRCPLPAMGNWECEKQPERGTIDTWARAAISTRTAADKAKEAKARELREWGAALSKSASPIRQTVKQAKTSLPKELTPEEKLLSRTVLLNGEQELDEEETVWREAKEREAKRKREAEIKQKKKKKEDEEKNVKMSKAKDEFKDKKFTYDSSGNVIWINAVNSEKLPTHISQANYKFTSMGAPNIVEKPVEPRRVKLGSKGGRPSNLTVGVKDDTFQRLAPQQPSMFEAMTLAPGVMLVDNGRTKRSDVRDLKPVMTREEYKQIIISDEIKDSSAPKVESQITHKIETSMETQELLMKDVMSAMPQSPPEPKAEESRAGVHSPSPEQKPFTKFQAMDQPPVMPAKIHDTRHKYLAIGYRPGQRDRMPISGTARMAQGHFGSSPHFAPPPTGATMGHGLIGDIDEFYFPNKPVARREMDSTDDSPKSMQKRKPNPRKPLERVVTRSRQFVEKLKYG